jgi:hypothetical protein
VLPAAAVVFRTGGYDGQFFYYLAAELGGHGRAKVDSDEFRRARIGFPLMAAPFFRALGGRSKAWVLPALLLALHLSSVWLSAPLKPESRLALWSFALNPFSLLSFLLCTADGAALSLATVGGLVLLSGSPGRRIGGAILVAGALLTKETLVVIPCALSLAAVLDIRSPIRGRLVTIALAAATSVPMLIWWQEIGFSLGLAAARGGFPMSGLVAYLPHADLQRFVIVVIVAMSLASGLSVLRDPARRVASLILLGTVALVSAATAGEYWGTFANIGRLVTPMAAAPLFAEGRQPGGGFRKFLTVATAASLLTLTALIFLREATRSPLPFFVAGEAGAPF